MRKSTSRATSAWLVALVIATSAAHAQAVRPFVTGGISLGVDALSCDHGVCDYHTLGGSNALGAGVALSPRLRLGIEYMRIGEVGFAEYCCSHVRLPLVTASLSPRAVPRLELRLAAGTARIYDEGGGTGHFVEAAHAPAGRVGLGYAAGGGRTRALFSADVVRAVGPKRLRYRATQVGVTLRLDLTRATKHTTSHTTSQTADAVAPVTRDTLRLRAGLRVRLRARGDRRWQVGRLLAAGPDTVRMAACPSCEVRTYPVSALRDLEWSDGRGRNAGFYGAVLGLPAGAVAGVALVIRTYRCSGGELCALGPVVLGGVVGAVAGATAGGLAGRHWTERWHAVPLAGAASR